MSALDDILKNANTARLIPAVADSRKEERLVSILLATLSSVPRLPSNSWSAAGRG